MESRIFLHNSLPLVTRKTILALRPWPCPARQQVHIPWHIAIVGIDVDSMGGDVQIRSRTRAQAPAGQTPPLRDICVAQKPKYTSSQGFFLFLKAVHPSKHALGEVTFLRQI